MSIWLGLELMLYRYAFAIRDMETKRCWSLGHNEVGL